MWRRGPVRGLHEGRARAVASPIRSRTTQRPALIDVSRRVVEGRPKAVVGDEDRSGTPSLVARTTARIPAIAATGWRARRSCCALATTPDDAAPGPTRCSPRKAVVRARDRETICAGCLGRLCFNATVSNLTDRPRNHATFVSGRQWRLSPAFDLTPSPAVVRDRRDLAMACGCFGCYAIRSNLLSGHWRFLLERGGGRVRADCVHRAPKIARRDAPRGSTRAQLPGRQGPRWSTTACATRIWLWCTAQVARWGSVSGGALRVTCSLRFGKD